MRYKVAVASADGKVVNRHFGRAEEFYIIEVDSSDPDGFMCVERRKVQACCACGDHDDRQLQNVIRKISDCSYVIVSRIGNRAQQEAEAHGIRVFELPGIIRESVQEMRNYLEIQNMIQELADKRHV